MKGDRKYLIAVALLAVIAVVFGVTGTVAPPFEPISPQQSASDPVPPYFIIPPNFDSGWLNITNKCGQYFNVTHNLNTTEVFVDITGKQVPAGGEHRRNFGGTGYAQGWSRAYGGTDDDFARSIVETGDGGYGLAGYTYSYGTGSGDFWLVKTDWTGDKEWDKIYGGVSTDLAYSLVETSDEGYALAGSTYGNSTNKDDCFLVKTDHVGNLVWERSYGGTDYDFARSVVQTSDGGYALAGDTNSHSAGFYDFWLVKTDSIGSQLWTRTYGGENVDSAYSLVLASDGGYALAGYTESYGAGNRDFWLVKTDANGNHLWNKTYGGTRDDSAYSMVQTSDGGYTLAGYTYSYGVGTPTNPNFWLVKTDSSGNMQWNRTYGGIRDEQTYSLVQTSDGGYALAGYTGSYGAGNADFWLVKTDASGTMQWNQTHGGTGDEQAYSVVQTGDGGYVLAGFTRSYGAGNADFWLVKTETEPGLAWTDSTNRTVTLYRGKTDLYWNFVRVRVWTIEEPTWQYGDINQDGVVDALDLYILGRNYGKTFSLISLGGIAAIAGIHTYKKRKQ